METMHAAVVTSFDEPPHYRSFEVPRPTSGDELLVDGRRSACTPASGPGPPASTTPAPAHSP